MGRRRLRRLEIGRGTPPAGSPRGLSPGPDCSGLLVDTWDKSKPSPLEVTAFWVNWIRARQSGRFVALAGRLDLAAIARLAPLQPDLFAVRGSACDHSDRRKTVSRERVAELVQTIQESARTRNLKSHTEYLTMNVPKRMGFVNITPQVEAAVKKSGVQEGLVLCNAMHITASVFINDNESGLHEDYQAVARELAPFDPSPQRYHHNRTGEDNADAHMKRQIMGREVVVAITNGRLDFGPWEQIFYGEFDGRRAKRVLIKVIGE